MPSDSGASPVASQAADLAIYLDEIKKLRYMLADLVAYTDRHRVTWPEHDHDCYEEWASIRDYIGTLLPKEADA